MTDDRNESAGDDKLDVLIAEYMARIDRGDHVDVDEFLEPHQDAADAFRSYLRNVEAIDQHPLPIQRSGDTNPSISADETLALRPNRPEYAAEFSLPRDFGRYRLKKELGRGAMGTVYLAQDTELKRDVALKQPRFSGGDEKALLERFYREAQAAATLNHPNICPVYDIGEYQGAPYITMAFVRGRTLNDVLRDSPNGVKEKPAAMLMRKVASALAEAHKRGIVHRDLKPSNIMVNDRNEPIVMDFGLARRFDAADDTRLTTNGMLVGTPAYMSPEQVECDDHRIGPQSDIYSIGVVFYEMLTGQLPFRGSVANVIAQIVRDEPATPSSLQPTLSQSIDEICMKMMCRSQADRFASMTAVVETLTKYLKSPSEQRVKDSEVPAASTADALRKQAEQVHKFIAANEWLKAEKELELMAASTARMAANYVTWANEQLVTVRNQIQQKRTVTTAIVRRAESQLEKHAYADAAGLLSKIEKPFRTKQSQLLMEEAIQKHNQVDYLFKQVEQSLRTGKIEGTTQHLQRLLQLKPDDPLVEYLFRKFKWQTRFGIFGSKLADAFAPAEGNVSRSDYEEPFLRKWLGISALVFLLFCCVTTVGVVTYINRSRGQNEIAFHVEESPIAERTGEPEVTPPPGSSVPDSQLLEDSAVELAESDRYLMNADTDPRPSPEETAVRKIEQTPAPAPATPVTKDPAPIKTTPRVQGRFSLFGEQQSHVLIPGLKYSGDYPITVEAVVTLDHAGHGPQTIVGNRDLSGFALVIGDNGDGYFQVRGKSSYSDALSDSTIMPGVVTHLAGTCDGKTVRLFVNGKRQRRFERFDPPHKPGGVFMIGADPTSITGFEPQHFFRGVIHSVRISNKIRYGSDFSPPLRMSPDEKTVACYDLNDLTDDEVTDLSSNGYHGVGKSIDRTDVLPSKYRFVLAPKSDGWQYSMETFSRFYDEEFPDANWKTGQAGFGSTSSSITRWETEKIYIRKTFRLQEIPSKADIVMGYDGTAIVYLNGRQVVKVDGYTKGYRRFEVAPALLKHLRRGDNQIAVYCKNTRPSKTNPGFIDVGISVD